MTQQGDNWWDKLYDDTAPDTAPTSSGDTLDDRFDSASRATGGATTPPPPQPTAPPPQTSPPQSAQPSQAPPPASPQPAVPTPQSAPPGQTAAPPSSSPQAVPPQSAAGLPQTAAPQPAPPLPAPAAGPSQSPPPPPSEPPVPQVPPAQAAPLGRAPWEAPGEGPAAPRTFPSRPPEPPPAPPAPSVPPPPDAPPATVGAAPAREPEAAAPPVAVPRPRTGHIGDRPPTYEPEPTALPAARPGELADLVADTVLDGARYGSCTLRAASVRGDSARYRGEPRRDALLTARFGHDEAALVLVAVAAGARAAEDAHLAAADACRWIGEAVGRSHARLSEDIRAGRRGDLKSGLHRLTDRTYGRLRGRAAERGLAPEEYTATLRCLLLSADPDCRTRVFFGIGRGGLFRLRDGAWQDIEPLIPEPSATMGAPVLGFGSTRDGEPEEADGLTMDLGITTGPGPFVEGPLPPPAEPFRFRASVARPGDTLLLASTGFADPLRGEPALAAELAARWAGRQPPGLAAFLADTQLRVKGYADDRTGVAVWEA